MSRSSGVLIFGVACASLLTVVLLDRSNSNGERNNEAVEFTPDKQVPAYGDERALERADTPTTSPTEGDDLSATRSQARPLEDAPCWLIVRLSNGGDASGIKIYRVDTETPLQDGPPRVHAGASELLGVIGTGGRAPLVMGCEELAAVALAYNANSFAVVPLNMQTGESVVEISPAVEEKFVLALPIGYSEIEFSGKFRFAAILNQSPALSWPDGVDGWRFGVEHFFSEYHLRMPVPKVAMHYSFLQFELSREFSTFTAHLPIQPHNLNLVDAPFGWSVMPTFFLPGDESIELRTVELRLRTICSIAQDGSPLPYPKSVRLALKRELPGGGWYTKAMLELPFQPQQHEGCVRYTAPLAHENVESSIVVELPGGEIAESEQFKDIPTHIDVLFK